MPSGGARPHSGPRRDPVAVRHGASDGPVDLGDGWTHLPHAGRRKRAPAWPFPDDEVDVAVLKMWAREWKRPQALMWEHQGQQVEVALYCLRVHQALEDTGKVSLGTLVRQQQQALGLNAPGLHMNRWVIDPPLPKAKPETATAAAGGQPTSGAASMRTRLSVVPDAPAGD